MRTPTVIAAASVALLMQISALLSCEFGSSASGEETIGLLRRRSLDRPFCHFYQPSGRSEKVSRHGAFVALSFSVLLFGVISLRCDDLLIAILFASASTCQSLTFLLFLSPKMMYSLDSGAMFSLLTTITMVVIAIFSVSRVADDDNDDDDDDDSDSTSSASVDDDRPAGVIGSEITFDVAENEQQQHVKESTPSTSPKTNFLISEKTGRKIVAVARSGQDLANMAPPMTMMIAPSSTTVYSTYLLFPAKQLLPCHPVSDTI